MEIFEAFRLIQKAKVIKTFLPEFELKSFELKASTLVLFFMPKKNFSARTYKFSKHRKYWVEIEERKTVFCEDLQTYLDYEGSLIVRKTLVGRLIKLCEGEEVCQIKNAISVKSKSKKVKSSSKRKIK